MYSFSTGIFPPKFCFFPVNNSICSYNTMHTSFFQLPLCRTNIRQFSISFQGLKFTCTIPLVMKLKISQLSCCKRTCHCTCRWKTVYTSTRPNAVPTESESDQVVPLKKMDFVLVGRIPGRFYGCLFSWRGILLWDNPRIKYILFTVEPHYLKLPTISNLNPFPLLFFFSHLLLVISQDRSMTVQ